MRTSDLELGTRAMFSGGSKNCLNSSQAVSDYLSRRLSGKSANSMMMILLDENHMVLCLEDVCALTDFSIEKSMPLILGRVSELQASSVILVQFQPSRSSSPFYRDRELVRSIKDSLGAQSVSLMDHLIVSRKDCFSFADHRLL